MVKNDKYLFFDVILASFWKVKLISKQIISIQKIYCTVDELAFTTHHGIENTKFIDLVLGALSYVYRSESGDWQGEAS